MFFYKKMPVQHALDQIAPYLEELYTSLQQKLLQFFTALSRFLQEARSDENVLIYLLENKQKLNAFLGERVIEELLQRFFPAGHSQLRAVICEGYTRRGFSSYFLLAEPLIDAIEWESCHPPLQML